MNQPQVENIIKNFKISCQQANSEDDIKGACNVFFHDISNLFELQISRENERTSVHGGRVDSIYNDIYFEYKKLGLFNRANNIGVDEALYGRDERDHGLYHYLINFSLEEAHNDNELFLKNLFGKVGVGFDGSKFIFCRFKPSNNFTNLLETGKTRSFPKNINPLQFVEFEVSPLYNFEVGVKRILMLIRSTQKKRLSSQLLCESFSAKSKLTQDTIPYLYDLLDYSLQNNSRVKTLYKEWERIFGEIYGEEQTDFVKYIKPIVSIYRFNVNTNDLEIRKVLFVIQTYYSIIIKLLINNLFASLKFPLYEASPICNKSELISLFHGKNYDFNSYIDNFYEINFFEWFTLVEQPSVYEIITEIILALGEFETTASVIKPEIVSDVLKETYESIMPKELRHLMGEYYTVEWLADFTINKSGYSEGLNETVLDPTCGSGIFLTHLIRRFSNEWSDLSYNERVRHIVHNFVGFDINPIAVIQAKGNYILSLGDITELDSAITIPIYMCDSILVPTVHAKQKESADIIIIDTSVGEFILPILSSRLENDIFLRTLSACILSDYTVFNEFKSRLELQDGIYLNPQQEETAQNLFNQLLTLHLSGKDGFWPIILKNSFAPLFCEQEFDYVIGNPPWIAWKAMSNTYRNLTLDIWLSYGIFEKNAYDKITSHDDFAMAVTYVAIDHYLKNNGRAALILPQTFVKSAKGGEGFRKFCITRDNQSLPFAITTVYDFLKVNPFKGIASNKTSVYIFQKDLQMTYPMNSYIEVDIAPNQKVDANMSIDEVADKLVYKTQSAKPINADDVRSPWLTLDERIMEHIEQYLGASEYRGRKGIEPCGAKGIYLINVVGARNGKIIIENLIERSRLQEAKDLGVHRGAVDADFVYPMIGGRNIKKWGVDSHIFMLVPHFNSGDSIYAGVPSNILKAQYPATYDWLFYFHDLLLQTRIRSAKFFDAEIFPWYRLDNVGIYTFKPYKVLWQEQAKSLSCCVVSTIYNEFVGNKTVVTDSKVLSISFDSEAEAHYVCAVLNSTDIEKIIQGYTIDTNRGVDIVKNVRIPKYNPEDQAHCRLSELSILAHNGFITNNSIAISDAEKEIDKIVSQIFGKA